LRLMAAEFVDPNRALLQSVQHEGPNAHRLQPSPVSDVNPDHLAYFEMLGTLVGVGIYQGGCLPVRFTLPFLKQLLRQPLKPDDLRAVDAVLYQQKVVKLMQYSEEVLTALDLTFAEEENNFGATKTIDLLNGAGGEDESVTIGNRSVYVKLLCHHLLTAKIKEQTAAVLRGLISVVPECILQAMGVCLTAEDFDVIIAGQQNINLVDWQSHTEYTNGFDRSSQQVNWFWSFVHKSEFSTHAKLLTFVTGSEAVGAGGFEAMKGYNGALNKFTISLGTGGDEVLPKAQTCFNKLILPRYSSADILESKLSLAIQEGSANLDEGAVAT